MTKTKDEFANPQAEDWWLVEETLSSELEPRRVALGAARGWVYATWYTEAAKLEELYDWLAANDSELLNNLDYAQDEPTRVKWLDDFVEAVSTEEETGREAEAEEVAAVPEAKDAGAPAAPVEAPKKSLFAKKHAADESEEAEAPSVKVEEEKAAAAAAEVLEKTDLPAETKKTLEEYITNSAVPVDAAEVADLLKEFPDDFETVFEEAKQGLDEEIDSFLSELEEEEGEGDEGDEGEDELEDEGEEVEA